MNVFSGLRESIPLYFLLLFTVLPAARVWGLGGDLAADQEFDLVSLYFSPEELVETATRSPKSILDVAENVTVITAAEIEAMNAHSLEEILQRIPGAVSEYVKSAFNMEGSLHMQGSDSRHNLVLLDGVSLNSLSGGNLNGSVVPVGIIRRIEIIKGPASSTWGSSLGGVINILTKDTGNTGTPSGKAAFSYGEMNTFDGQAELSGKTGRMGYFFHANKQDTEGQRKIWDFDKSSIYGKLEFAMSPTVALSFTGGYAVFKENYGELPVAGLLSDANFHNSHVTSSLDFRPTKTLGFNFSVRYAQQKYMQFNNELGLWISFGPGYERGDLFQNNFFSQKTSGASGRMQWNPGGHQVVMGVDYDRGRLTQTSEYGAWRQWQGAEAATAHSSALEKWAVYLNDTFAFGKLVVTPGIRYDTHSITESAISPSLGLAYRLSAATVLRGVASQGFNSPPLSYLSGGGVFFDPNPNLEAEKVTSFQGGVETAAGQYIWVKFMLFRHDLRNAIDDDIINPDTGNGISDNRGDIRRVGGELVLETVSYHNFKLGSAFSYVQVDHSAAPRNQDIYTIDLKCSYDDGHSWKGELFGRYYWPDEPVGHPYNYADFKWDLNISYHFDIAAEMFFTAHNLFDGTNSTNQDYGDIHRWTEIGLRWMF